MNDFHRILLEKYAIDFDGSSETRFYHEGHQCNRYQAILSNAIEHQRLRHKIEDSLDACKAVNQNFNQPPLSNDEVETLVTQVFKPFNDNLGAAKKPPIALDLHDGILQHTLSSPKRPFLFGNDIIPMNTLSVIGGLGGSGKSMAMVEMICASAIGGAYANRE